ncbi:MAG: tetratricopeptide repeat protein [Bdellovibrionaceae bacterium]|nr:tetratricopeptide repeat protein [Pseudobdellovibrionaceae bacterium]NUM58134.1 tetratricopeptide repeat protein [Pseudobdellovibrionaceae bacterium]
MIQNHIDSFAQRELSDDRNFELGKLHADRGDFDNAIKYLSLSADQYFQQRNFSDFLKCKNILLRIYAEREQFEDINFTKEQLQDLVLKEGFDLNSKTYYTLATCACYKSQYENALDYAQKSLSLALAQDSKEDICNSIFLIALVYSFLGKHTDALKEIYNLQVFFQVYNFPELKISTKLLNTRILRELKKYDEALTVAWETYEEAKELRNNVININILGMLGVIYFESGDKELSRLYLGMASKMVDAHNQVRLNRMIQSFLSKLGGESKQAYDIVFDEANHCITEKKIGQIDFKNQFILLDLLKLLVLNQGLVFSKEYLVENVWKQPYDPAIHDNKIYVTIKRLRKLIEPDYDKPKYIFRAKNGYYFNKSVKVLMEK